MANYKQYTQNTWFRWMNTDRQSTYSWQFQYWKNINPRDENGWVRLSSLLEQAGTDENFVKIFEIDEARTLYITEDWRIFNKRFEHKLTLNWFTTSQFNNPMQVIKFRDYIFISATARIWVTHYSIHDRSGSVSVDPIYEDTNQFTSEPFACALNYADTFALFGRWPILLRYAPISANPADEINRKIIRNWSSIDYPNINPRNRIVWLSEWWNYVRVYVEDWHNTKIHYLQWTFDLEESWLYQTITVEWILHDRWLASEWGTDYWLFIDWNTERLYEINWYWTTLIRATEFSRERWVGLFTPNSYTQVQCYNWTVYVNTTEWIWTFKKFYIGTYLYIWWWVIQWWDITDIYDYVVTGSELIWVAGYTTLRCSLEKYPEKYQPEWILVWSVYTAWCTALFKKNVQATVCWKTNWWIMELWYRYDRVSYIWDSAAHIIKEIKDIDIYEIIVPTSLIKESDELSTNFNKPWNTLEYVVKFKRDVSDETQSPILYEHTLIYEDSMRKYR